MKDRKEPKSGIASKKPQQQESEEFGNVKSRQIDEVSIGRLRQPGDQGCGQSTAAHVVECPVIQHKIGMTAAQQIEKVQPALRSARAEPGEAVVADLRAEAVLGLMPRTGVVDTAACCSDWSICWISGRRRRTTACWRPWRS